MPKVSIAKLMVLVGLVAIFLAAAIAGAFWFVVVTLSMTSLAAIKWRGELRAFFAGFSVVGWALMIWCFVGGWETRRYLPATRLIVTVYQSIFGDIIPPVFKSREEGEEWIRQLYTIVDHILIFGYSAISLLLGLIAGLITWLLVRMKRRRMENVTIKYSDV